MRNPRNSSHTRAAARVDSRLSVRATSVRAARAPRVDWRLSARAPPVLILRLRVSRSAIGISVKTQELFLLVFVTRYLDLFTTFYSLYNSLMKVAYIVSTSYIVFMIKYFV